MSKIKRERMEILAIAKRFLIIAAIFGLGLLSGTRAEAIGLGLANDFNLFMLGGVERTSGDVFGRAAIGGNAQFTDFWISRTHPSDPGGNLIVGEDLTLNRVSIGSDKQGTAIVGGSWSITDSGNIPISQGQPIDFAAEKAYLTQYAKFWAGLAANGTTVLKPGEVTLSGSDPLLNIFSLSGSDLGKIRLDIQVPKGSTVLVNLSGKDAQMYSLGYGDFAIDPHLILYNFYEASTLNLNHIGVEGSILAPYAKINFESGNVEGNLIGLSLLSYKGEEHDFPFEGDLPSVPEAASLFLLGSGLIILWVFRNKLRVVAPGARR
jgi:choice-of-anchor A domain-containing protein